MTEKEREVERDSERQIMPEERAKNSHYKGSARRPACTVPRPMRSGREERERLTEKEREVERDSKRQIIPEERAKNSLL